MFIHILQPWKAFKVGALNLKPANLKEKKGQ